ncbi:MAG: thiosulfate oxidation carrier complex protein SoxZ [Deltaproteobacteria bacterium]|nr:thiosulfate oxidation carrier complex protein SoxZ [Deltaproteobacteria bacterium]
MLAGIFTGLKSRFLLALEPSPTTLKELHTPNLILPAMTRNGTHVPVAVKMNHPMEPHHYIRQIQFLNEADPIPSKGIFHPTPANGELHFAFQARMHSGTSTVLAVAECNLHGKWTGRSQITIPDGQGGCATADGTKEAKTKEEILPPVIRIPELVRRGRLVKGETAEVQVKFKHPSKTGLLYENKKFVQVEEPLYVKSMQVFYGDRVVSRYEMTPGLSDNPFLKFKLKFVEAKPIRVVFTNSLGRQYTAFTEVALS